MQPSDRAAFKTLLSDVMAFYRQDVSTFALSVWWQACERFEYAQVATAMTAHAMDAERGRFAPKPADIVCKLDGTQTDRSLIAWGKVYDAMLRVGAYESVAFDDGAIHAAVSDMGGWTKVCRMPLDELQFTQKRFCDLHRAYSCRPEISYPSHLIGEHEATNRLEQRRVKPPVLIGDVDRACEVYRLGSSGPKTSITAAEALPGLRLIGRTA